jgi:hypothetical protein
MQLQFFYFIFLNHVLRKTGITPKEHYRENLAFSISQSCTLIINIYGKLSQVRTEEKLLKFVERIYIYTRQYILISS